MLLLCVHQTKLLHSYALVCNVQTSSVSAAAVLCCFLVGLRFYCRRWRNKKNEVNCFTVLMIISD